VWLERSRKTGIVGEFTERWALMAARAPRPQGWPDPVARRWSSLYAQIFRALLGGAACASTPVAAGIGIGLLACSFRSTFIEGCDGWPISTAGRLDERLATFRAPESHSVSIAA